MTELLKELNDVLKPNLHDYMKAFEAVETSRKAEKGKPIIVRLDGKNFSTFTRGLKKPFDIRLTNLMRDTTQMLVEQSNALIGYTQSDEISLVYYMNEGSAGQYFFDGRFQKIGSVLTSMATGYFIRQLDSRIPEKYGQTPMLDARVFQVPTLNDAAKALLWRERDAIKNSITMAASEHFSHKQLHKVTSAIKLEWLRSKDAAWEDLPTRFTKGSYFRRCKVLRELTPQELSMIPEGHRPIGLVERTIVSEVNFPDLSLLDNLTDIFDQSKTFEEFLPSKLQATT